MPDKAKYLCLITFWIINVIYFGDKHTEYAQDNLNGHKIRT